MENVTHYASAAEPHVYDCELTDTYGGEANYSWVRREAVRFERPYTEMQLRRAIKAALGLTGVRCEADDNAATYWDVLTLRPRGCCMIAFATMREAIEKRETEK